jgi:hypothetical protein
LKRHYAIVAAVTELQNGNAKGTHSQFIATSPTSCWRNRQLRSCDPSLNRKPGNESISLTHRERSTEMCQDFAVPGDAGGILRSQVMQAV